MNHHREAGTEPGRFLFLFGNEKNSGLKTIDATDSWPALSRTLEKSGAKLPFLFSDPRLNLELPFQLTCREQSVPATIGTGYNMPWTLETIKLISSDTIIGPTDLVRLLLEAYEKRFKTLPACKHIILVRTKETEEQNESVNSFKSAVTYIAPPVFTDL